MQTGVMITNGGPHSAEKWAVVTAGQIIQIGANAAGDDAMAGRKLELKIIDVLEQHHNTVQDAERKDLVKHGDLRLTHTIAPDYDHDLDDMVKDIVAAAKGTKWESHFMSAEVQTHIRNVLGTHFATSMDIERQSHADRVLKKDPNHPVAKAYRQLHAEVGGGHVWNHHSRFPTGTQKPKGPDTATTTAPAKA